MRIRWIEVPGVPTHNRYIGAAPALYTNIIQPMKSSTKAMARMR